MKVDKKLFLVLWLMGMAGVLSLLFIDFSVFMEMAPKIEPEADEAIKQMLPYLLPFIKVASIISPTLLVSVAVLVGVLLADKVGLFSSIAEAVQKKRNFFSAFAPQIIPGLIGGAIGGTLMLITLKAFMGYLPTEFLEKAARMDSSLPLVTRLLYGGITEELLLRWGLMTLLVFGLWRVFQKNQEAPESRWFVHAILISAFIFAIGHLPAAFSFSPRINAALVIYIIVGNAAFGLMAGYLYWKKGLESAMIAHTTAHLAAYFANLTT